MKKLVAAAATYVVFLPASYSMGMFRRHHDDPSSASREFNTSMVSRAPEAETYLLMLVGIALVAWVVRNRKE